MALPFLHVQHRYGVDVGFEAASIQMVVNFEQIIKVKFDAYRQYAVSPLDWRCYGSQSFFRNQNPEFMKCYLPVDIFGEQTQYCEG